MIRLSLLATIIFGCLFTSLAQTLTDTTLNQKQFTDTSTILKNLLVIDSTLFINDTLQKNATSVKVTIDSLSNNQDSIQYDQIPVSNTPTVSGTIIDAKDKSPLIGVNVLLTNTKDTTQLKGASTDLDGNFIIENVEKGNYKLNISYISYKSVDKIIDVNGSLNLQTISISEDSKLLKEVVIEEKQIRVQQLGDTSQFNAGAFKTNKDATTEDLLTKMPGVTSDNGTVKVNGEEVKRVLVDGKPFFGDDPRTAIQNLPRYSR